MAANGILVFKDSDNIIVKILTKETFSVGRSTADSVILISQGVSRSHATIHFSDNAFWIADGDLKGRISTNGLFINNRKVTLHKLKPYDIVAFCKGAYALFLEGSDSLETAKSFENSVKQLVAFLSKQTNQKVYFSKDSSNDTDEPLKETLIAKLLNPHLDELTKLPSKSAFLTRVSKSLEFKKNISNDHQFAILFVDVDRFKMINDSLGHAVGDTFLIKLAERFKQCLRPNDVVARLGGDEFAILLDNLNESDEAVSITQRFQQYSATPLQIENHELYPSLSIGIALSCLEYQTVEEIIRDADTAMYQAKNEGRSRFVVFDQEMHQKATSLLKLHSDLRRAAENQEFQLYYQPIISIKEKDLIGFEALIRWNHKDRGFISPIVFIPIAEEINLINQIGQWVLDEACHQLSLWKQNPAVKNPLSMNVNLSSKQLSDIHLVDKIKTVLDTYGIEPGELKLELTESIVMENSQHSIKVFSQLKQLGVQLAIDDFGTGYSSLSYLSRFPIDTLKIDRSFVSEIDSAEDNSSINITHSIIGLAHNIGAKVVAEGVENLNQLACLEHLNCDYAQGYLFSQPLAAQEATHLAEKGIAKNSLN